MSGTAAVKASDVVTVLLKIDSLEAEPIPFPDLQKLLPVDEFLRKHAYVHPDVPGTHKGGELFNQRKEMVSRGWRLWKCRFNPADDDELVIFILKPPAPARIAAGSGLLGRGKGVIQRHVRRPTQAPSTFAEVKHVADAQNAEVPLYAAFRPAPRWEPIPPELVHPVFAKFLEDADSLMVTAADCQAVLSLCTHMSEFYDNELQRNNKFLEDINAILRGHTTLLEHLTVEDAKSEYAKSKGALPSTDGHSTVPFLAKDMPLYKLPNIMLEVKPELGVGKGEPVFEALAYISGLLKTAESFPLDNVFPSFILTLVGPFFMVGACYCVEDPTNGQEAAIISWYPLTPLLPLLVMRNEREAMTRVVRVFKALALGGQAIDRYYADLEKGKGDSWELLPPLRDIRTETGTVISLKGWERLYATKLLFTATTDAGATVLVKFTKQYGANAHRKLAALGLAPTLIAISRVAGYYAVIMDLLDEHLWCCLPDLELAQPDLFTSQIAPAIQGAFNMLVDAKVVHGDLHPANIMVCQHAAKVEVKFVDFDWAYVLEVDTPTTYPSFINTTQLSWAAGVEVGSNLTAEHDRFLVDQLCRGGDIVKKRGTPNTSPVKEGAEGSTKEKAESALVNDLARLTVVEEVVASK